MCVCMFSLYPTVLLKVFNHIQGFPGEAKSSA